MVYLFVSRVALLSAHTRQIRKWHAVAQNECRCARD